MQLRATRREMAKAYREHRKCCTDVAVPSFKLLALYCIECGVKALLMKQYVVEDSDELPTDAMVGHNVVAALKLLRAPVSLFKLKDLRITTSHSRPPQQEVSVTNLHQALRYGIPMTMANESAREIANILGWLEGRFNEF